MPMDNVTLENTQQSISSRDAKSVASVMVNGKWVNLSDTLEQANVKSDVGTVAKQVAAQQEVVSNAVSVADSAQSAADAAVASAQVTSDAVSAIASATAEAKQGANDAMSRALSAWDVATGAKEAVTDFDPLIKSAQSDASKALAQIADTANALSDAKTTFGSGVAEAKELAITAQTTANSAVESAGENAKELASQANALSDAKKAIDSDVASAKGLANAAQATADNAIKSASSVANDLSVVASQAKSNANEITKVTSDVGLLQTTVANNTGDISTIQETAKQIQQSVSDNAGNITVAKQAADSAVAVASDARSNATVAIQTASQASITANNASGQAASAVLTAQGALTTASNAKSDATVAIQTASGASLTAVNAQSDATVAKQTASEAKVQASNAESDFAQLSIRAGQIEASVANNSGAIASVQQTANGLTTTVAGIKANGGGRNLLTGTAKCEFPLNSNGGTQAVQKYDDETNYIQHTSNTPIDRMGPWWPLTPEVGQVYTLSADVCGNGYIQGEFHYEGGESGSLGRVNLTNDWQRISNTFRVNTISGNWVIYANNSTLLKVKHIKVEKGMVAHDWSPAPEDLQNQFTQTKESIDGIATIINDPKTGLNATYQTAAGNATTISNVKSDVYQLQTTATGLTSRVGNLESKTNTQETEIQQNKNAIALKADQTNVDTLKGNVTDLQAKITTQANEIENKVTRSDVTSMLTGYATQDYTQSLVTQQAGTISESIVKLGQTVKQGAENNVQLVRKSDFEDGDKGDWGAQTVVTTDPPAELGQSGMKVLQTNSRDAYEDDVWYSVKPGENFDVDFWCKPSTTCYSQLGLVFADKDYNILAWYGIATDQSGQWKHYTGTITAPANASFAKPWFQMNKDGSNTTDTALLAKPSIRRQNATTVAAIQQITASIDGLQSNVTNLKNDTSSQITQLSTAVQSKVSQGDYNSQITQLQNDINLRVSKGDVISQVNQEAGGNTLIQVSNGKGSLILDADNTVITGKAWIPSAAIANLTADDITTGTLKGVKVDFRDSTGTGMIADGSTLTFDVSNTPAGYLSYNGMPVAELPDGSGGNELAIRYGLSTAIIPDDNSGAQATFSKAAQKIAYMTGTNQGKQMLSGLEVHSNNHHWLCAVNSDATCNRFEVNDRDGLNIAWHDNTHFWISDGNAKLYQDNNDSQTATKLEIHGWAWVNGWVEAAGHSQHSTLSSKTRIEEADPNHMLDLVNNTELTTFAFKSEVAEGTEARHIGPIIDDVNDVAQYRMPAEFIAPTKTARDDDNMIGALFGAVQALTKRIKALESKVG